VSTADLQRQLHPDRTVDSEHRQRQFESPWDRRDQRSVYVTDTKRKTSAFSLIGQYLGSGSAGGAFQFNQPRNHRRRLRNIYVASANQDASKSSRNRAASIRRYDAADGCLDIACCTQSSGVDGHDHGTATDTSSRRPGGRGVRRGDESLVGRHHSNWTKTKTWNYAAVCNSLTSCTFSFGFVVCRIDQVHAQVRALIRAQHPMSPPAAFTTASS